MDQVGELLATQWNRLKPAGGDFFLMACNTVHAADEYVERSVDLPFIHIVDPTARQAVERGFSNIGMLGSRYTMTGDYFVGRLRERDGLDVWLPRANTRPTCTTPCMTSWPKASS